MKEYKFPEVLKNLLEKNKLSQRKLADKLDVTTKRVNNWATFNSTPDIFNIMEIADMFNVSLDFLIYGEEK